MNAVVDRDDKGFRRLVVWQRAHELVLSVYKMTEKFPKSEMFALTSQIRRAVVSVPANIAEGQGAGPKPQFARYLQSIAEFGKLKMKFSSQFSMKSLLNYETSDRHCEGFIVGS